MSDDDGSDHGARGDSSPGGDAAEPAVLPEHASAYYSPRSPPAVTLHRTLETAAVTLDSSVDPRAQDTQRVSIDGLDPPPWLTRGSDAVSNDPTVLVPVVRARRFRRRLLAVTLVAVAGATLGAWFGLMRDAGPRVLPQRAATHLAPLTVTPAVPVSAALGLTTPHSVPATGASPGSLPPAPAPTGSALSVPHGASRRIASAPSVWFKAEPPKAWIK